MEYVFSFLPPRLQAKLLLESGKSGGQVCRIGPELGSGRGG